MSAQPSNLRKWDDLDGEVETDGQPTSSGDVVAFSDISAQDKDASLPIIVSLADHIMIFPEFASTVAMEFGFNLRQGIRDWAPNPAGSFGIHIRCLVRGPRLEDRVAKFAKAATCEYFHTG